MSLVGHEVDERAQHGEPAEPLVEHADRALVAGIARSRYRRDVAGRSRPARNRSATAAPMPVVSGGDREHDVETGASAVAQPR